MFSQILPQNGSDSAGHCPTISKVIIQIPGRKSIREMVKGVNLENCASSGTLLATLLSSCELRHVSGCPFSPPEKVTILRMSKNRYSKWPEQKLNPRLPDSNGWNLRVEIFQWQAWNSKLLICLQGSTILSCIPEVDLTWPVVQKHIHQDS